MSTIPASALVQILPSVISAGGSGLVLNGLMLSNSYRLPIGTVPSFVSAAAVGAVFGLASPEYAQATIYFNSFIGASIQPGSLLSAQYNQTDVAAWLQSAPNTVLANIQAITASALNITVDGYPRTVASLNLSSATSFTAAATLIATALNTTEPTEATVTAAIAPGTFSVTGLIADEVLTVNTVSSGSVVVGAAITGTGIPVGTRILSQFAGSPGGVGTYEVSTLSAVSLTTVSGTYGTLTVSAVTSGTVSVGQTVTGGSTSAGTAVTAYGTGAGLTGTYIVNNTQTVSSGTLTLVATNLTVTYDTVSNGFLITSGITGTPSTIAFASGAAAVSLGMTQATGATISQGAPMATPSAFMAGITAITQNWATFWTVFNPDDIGSTAKLAFAAWTSTTNNRYAYICWSNEVLPTLSSPATSSLGYLINTVYNYSGTSLWYDPNNEGLAAFQAGIAASLNFNAVNGRTTFAFRSQSGLVATVTNQQVGANLIANGYNFYGAYGTANAQFTWNNNGTISGPFQWLDSYCNQIWMNNEFQLDFMNLLGEVGSIPYNAAGYAMLAQAVAGTIAQALSYGVIRSGIPLSSNEIIVVNNQAGFRIDNILSTQGWFLYVQPATPQIRQARQSPVIYFWYTDGQSVQQIVMNSVELE